MTEKEKMLAGLPYDAGDKQLREERMHARMLLHKFNHSMPDAKQERVAVLTELFGSYDGGTIEPNFRCDYGSNIYFGKNFYANFDCVILDVCEVHIGDNCMFGPGVHIYTAGHPLNAVERNSGIEFGSPVTLGESVWVGGHVSILPGVHIGNNVVIGSGSVVTKDFPDDVVIAGNPAKIIKHIDNK
ncbi:maltose acetyltransferase domain-containing protein [Culicoidibacter larvae]|uniref:Acetyltransferase n=1 Tax=Culicoidibacter larvae TaxID=2579976 RepID=A0A5R8QB95_9FIRM|nr:maltose acetyltransferase domain-containing protein [Culicoidibacter larvae]TLG72929.1 maltose O-acetyltransferase [Culicoidibacter larvae]